MIDAKRYVLQMSYNILRFMHKGYYVLPIVCKKNRRKNLYSISAHKKGHTKIKLIIIKFIQN